MTTSSHPGRDSSNAEWSTAPVNGAGSAGVHPFDATAASRGRDALDPAASGDRVPLVTSVLAAAAVMAAVVIGTFVAVVAPADRWTAERSLVVLPITGRDGAVEAQLYETLSRGQVVENFAEVARSEVLVAEAAAALGLSPADQDAVVVETNAVASTSIVLVRASAADPALADAISSDVAARAAVQFERLSQPFRVEVVGERPAQRAGRSPLVVMGASILLAVALGVAVQQGVRQVFELLRAR